MYNLSGKHISKQDVTNYLSVLRQALESGWEANLAMPIFEAKDGGTLTTDKYGRLGYDLVWLWPAREYSETTEERREMEAEILGSADLYTGWLNCWGKRPADNVTDTIDIIRDHYKEQTVRREWLTSFQAVEVIQALLAKLDLAHLFPELSKRLQAVLDQGKEVNAELIDHRATHWLKSMQTVDAHDPADIYNDLKLATLSDIGGVKQVREKTRQSVEGELMQLVGALQKISLD